MTKVWLLLALLLCAFEAWAAGRVALVIGNDDYRSFAPLAQAVNDADRVAGTLEALPVPFSVTRRVDADRLQMQRAVEQFSNRLAEGSGDVALFYYAGHAVSHNGDVWLLPVDAQVQEPSDVEAMGWSLRWLSGKLQRGNWKATVVVLDACRNALFADGKEPPGLRGEALPRGLIPIPQIKGLMVAYATAASEVAREDTARGGYYTQRLVANLKMPGLKLQDVFNATALEVERQTRQRPELMMTAMEEIYLAGRGVVVKPSPLVPAGEGELRIEVSPAGARVRLDGVLLGTGSRSVKEAAGKTVVVRAEAEGHEPLEERVRVQGGQVADVVLRLKPLVAAQPDPVRPEPPLVSSVPLPAMVEVPAGTFQMGSPSYEEGRESDEGPVREVRIKAFRLGKYEVTRGEFGRFVSATGYRTQAEKNVDVPDSAGDWAKGPNPGCYGQVPGTSSVGWSAALSWRDPGFDQDNDHPVVCVSWNDAQEYVKWLNRETGRRYRLPSEAEQEYAIRATSRTAYAWGSDAKGACAYANVRDTTPFPNGGVWSDGVRCSDGVNYASRVGRYRANVFGLHDTVGNVSEWGQDCYKDSYRDAPVDGSAYEAGGCERRVLRGAAWSDRPARLRSANRIGLHPAYRSTFAGFRLAEDL